MVQGRTPALPFLTIFSLPYSPSKHPDPFEDGIDKMKPSDICAFKDYQQALEWFDEDMVDFLKIEGGWFLSTYRVEESTTKYRTVRF